MDKLKHQVAKARRRLLLQQFANVLPWCWFATFAAAAVAIAVQKMFLVTVDGWRWSAWWLGGAAIVGLLAAVVSTWLIRHRRFDAAMEIDRRFGLKERISSCLALEPEELRTPCGQALLDDALQRIGALQIAERFPLAISRRALLPLAPAAFAFLLCWLADPTNSLRANVPTDPMVAKQVHESVEQLQKRVEDRAKKATQSGSNGLASLLKKVAEELHKLKENAQFDRQEALAKLHDLGEELNQQQAKLDAAATLQQQFAELKHFPAGPLDKFAEAIKEGDFEKAAAELQKLQDRLTSGQLDHQQQTSAIQQMNTLHDALQKFVDRNHAIQADLKKQLDAANQSGDRQALRNAQQQLANLQAHQAKIEAITELSYQLSQCAKCVQSGKSEEAKTGLNQLAQQLARIGEQAGEMEMLEATMHDLAGAKMAMTGSQAGAEASAALRNPNGGTEGIGHHQGDWGVLPNSVHAEFYDAPLKQPAGQGTGVVVGQVDGPNLKGKALERIKAQMEAVRQESAEPLTGQTLPRAQRDHVQQYFDAFRTGE